MTLGSRALAQDFTGGRQAGISPPSHTLSPAVPVHCFPRLSRLMLCCGCVCLISVHYYARMPAMDSSKVDCFRVLSHGHLALALLACVEAEHCGGECRQKQSLAARK